MKKRKVVIHLNDFQWILDLISNVGFPIFVCLVLLYQGKKEEDKHEEEVNKLSDALNANTLVLQKLVDAHTTSKKKE